MIDTNTLHCLNDWQGVDPVPEGAPPIVAEPPQDANTKYDELNHIEKIIHRRTHRREKIHFNKRLF